MRTETSGFGKALGGRPLVLLPWLIVVVTALVTGLLVVQRSQEIGGDRDTARSTAESSFKDLVNTVGAGIRSEIGRIDTLGQATLAAGGAEGDVGEIERYLEQTGSLNGADGQLDVSQVFISTRAPGTDEETIVSVVRLDDDAEIPPDAVTNVLGDLESGQPLLLDVGVDDTRQILVSFPGEPLPSGERVSVTFAFVAETFLGPLLDDHESVRFELIDTGVDAGELEALSAPDRAAVEALESGETGQGFVHEVGLPVFGSLYFLRGVADLSDAGAFSSREVVVILLIGGIFAVFGFLAARNLVQARARALAMATSARREREQLAMRFRAGFENAPVGMAELDDAGRFFEVNQALCEQAGQTRHELIGRPLSDLVHPRSRSRHLEAIERLLTGEEEAIQSEHAYLHPDGTEIWVSESISRVEDPDGRIQGLLVQAQDVTARRRAAWQLARQALRDELTGLPNRVLLMDQLRKALDRSARNDSMLGLMFIDVDRFKVVNDSLGHEKGDRLLVEIASRIGTAVRSGDTVGRFGGDEFVVLCEDLTGQSEVMAIADRIRRAIGAPITLDNKKLYVTASVGITMCRGGGEAGEAMLRDADAAMYRAKEAGRDRSELFDNELRAVVVEQMELGAELRTALRDGELQPWFQPIVDAQTLRPLGYEGLVRWNHPTRGVLPPGAFIGIAEEAGILHNIDAAAVRESCRLLTGWSAEYPRSRSLYLSTNWAPSGFNRFVVQIEQVLAETSLDPQRLVVEVTENALLEDTEASIDGIAALKALGLKVAIDDFGTGYSSLSYLTRFEPDQLKIDRSFVMRLPEDKATMAVVRAITDMAAGLGMTIVAEGVETTEQLHVLQDLGVPRLQGYLFAKPKPAEAIAEQLANGTLDAPIQM